MGNLVFCTCVKIVTGCAMQFRDSGATCNTLLVGKRTFSLRLKKHKKAVASETSCVRVWCMC